MKKQILFFILLSFAFSQGSIDDLRRLANQDLDKIRQELQSQADQSIIDTEDVSSDAPGDVSISSTAIAIATGDFFGYNYFRKDISFFDNIPTPSDYKLGPGDELIISIWGETNIRKTLTINKDGMIFFNNIGFINLSNFTIAEAQYILTKELSKIYSTLIDSENPSKLMLSLGQIKSINIYFTGQVENPGINLVHPFSDIFSAIVQAGGINKNGSLRNVQLIRDGTIISVVDFYSFFISGENVFSDIKLIDGDVIHIPNVKKRVSISGAITRPTSYELIENENINDLIDFASGLTTLASTTLLKNSIIPANERSSDDYARTSTLLKMDNISSTALNDGDEIIIQSITSVDNQVEVLGRVKSPGFYPANDIFLKTVLDLAGGFDDPVYRKSIFDSEIIVLRKNKSDFYSKEFKVSYKSSDNFKLYPGDKIFVYSDSNYLNNFVYEIIGEVAKPGTYPLLKNNLTLREAINIAGGITDIGSSEAIVVKTLSSFIDTDGSQIIVDEPVRNIDMGYIISRNAQIQVLPSQKVIRVIGNVYNPGLIYTDRSLSLNQLVKLSGGYLPRSLKRGIYISKLNGNKVPVGMLKLKRVYPGDTVVIPKKEDRESFNMSTFVANLASTLANIAAILIVVDNNKN